MRNAVFAQFAVLAVGAAGMVASDAVAAAMINLDTGTASWRLASFTPTHQPYASQVSTGTFGTIGAVAPTISPHSSWNKSLNSEASWIAPTSNGNSFGTGGLYEYSLDLTGSLTPGKTYTFTSQYVADNGLVGALYNTTSQSITLPANSTDWANRKELSFSFVADATSVFKLRIYNADNTGTYGPADGASPSSTANPTGFILSGNIMEITPTAFVPEPGLTGIVGVLGLLGLGRVRRSN